MQSAGVGEFWSSLGGSLASAYASNALSETFCSHDGLSSLGHICESRNGHLLEVEIVGFNKQQFNSELIEIKESIFEKAVAEGISEPEAIEIAEIQAEEIAGEIVEFKKKANEVENLAREAKESSTAVAYDQIDSAISPDQALQTELLLNRSVIQTSAMENQIMDCLDRLTFAQPDLSPREQVEAMVPRNKAEAAMQKATLLRYDMEDFIARNPNAANWCSKIFVGTMYTLQGLEYAGVAAVSGPFGVAGRFAVQETTGHAIEHGVEASSRESARLMTDNPALQQEFADTIKCTAYAGLCVGSAKASKKLVGALAKGAVSSTERRVVGHRLSEVILSESEIIRRAGTIPGEWNGQFKLIREIPATATRTEFASRIYSREVLFKDPRTGQMFRAFQRNDIDPGYILRSGDNAGRSNLEVMSRGLAPHTSAGVPVIIHHLGQSAYGPFVEVTKTTHKPFLHNQFGYGKPHPTAPVIRAKFNPIREAYWRSYAESFK